jgi:hypothetical protein
MEIINKILEYKYTIIFFIVLIGLFSGIIYGVHTGNEIMYYISGGILFAIIAFIIYALTHCCVA